VTRAVAAAVALAALLSACGGGTGGEGSSTEVLGATEIAPVAAVRAVAPEGQEPARDDVAAAVAAAGVAASGTVARALSAPERAPGTYQRVIEVAGVRRSFTVVVPAGRDPEVPAPLLVAFHGVGANGAAMRANGFERNPAAAGMVLVFPEANGGSWNDGRPGMVPLVPGTETDDVAFVRALIDETVQRSGVDPSKVAVTGFSNGALMASRIACDLSDRVGAAALVSGAGSPDYANRCASKRSVPVLVVFGTADGTVPYKGGEVAPNGKTPRGRVGSVDEVIGTWHRKAGCAGWSSSKRSTGKPAVTEVVATGCGGGARVVLERVEGGGHEWLRRADFDTTDVVLRFVRESLS
jgi:polyhydroxybutyrate depolymerase